MRSRHPKSRAQEHRTLGDRGSRAAANALRCGRAQGVGGKHQSGAGHRADHRAAEASAGKSGERFEIVAGERRWRASREAGLDTIPAIVRTLDDSQVLEIQLVENLHREGLHELEEAEGYEILMQQHHYDIEQLVAKVGRSRAYVYARLKLLALDKKSRDAFYAGKLTAATALLLARIPVPALQQEALKAITDLERRTAAVRTRNGTSKIAT